MVAAEARPRIQQYLKHSTTLTLHCVRWAVCLLVCSHGAGRAALSYGSCTQVDPAQRARCGPGLLCARDGLPAGGLRFPGKLHAWQRRSEPLAGPQVLELDGSSLAVRLDQELPAAFK